MEDNMSDVTFGVKVTEEMKNELSDLMKINDLSGKEFMTLLLSSYKMEQTKQENPLFANDLSELQILLQRIQNIYIHMNEKSKTVLAQNQKQFEEVLLGQKEENHSLDGRLKALEEKLELQKKENEKAVQEIEALKEKNKKIQEEAKESHLQAKNYLLLHEKFEQEIKTLKSELEHYIRLEGELEECHRDNTTLQNRNDELASEIWFLKREKEKLEEEKKQLLNTHQLELKNHLLEQKLALSEKIEALKEENIKLQHEFNNRLQNLYEAAQNKTSDPQTI